MVCITRKYKKIVFDYKLNDVSLEHVSEMKDLGNLLSSDLTWNKNVDNMVARANKTMGMIKRACGYQANTFVTKKLYLTLVRCKVEYSSQTWAVQTKRNLTLIEGVQRRATCYILGVPRDSLDYKERLTKQEVLPLSYRREMLDVKFLFKCFQNEIDIDLQNYVTTVQNRTREGFDGVRLQLPKFKTESYAHSYFIRIVPIWNQLPLELRDSPNLYVFTQRLKLFYTAQLKESFNCDNTCTWVSKCRCSKCRPCF